MAGPVSCSRRRRVDGGFDDGVSANGLRQWHENGWAALERREGDQPGRPGSAGGSRGRDAARRDRGCIQAGSARTAWMVRFTLTSSTSPSCSGVAGGQRASGRSRRSRTPRRSCRTESRTAAAAFAHDAGSLYVGFARRERFRHRRGPRSATTVSRSAWDPGGDRHVGARRRTPRRSLRGWPMPLLPPVTRTAVLARRIRELPTGRQTDPKMASATRSGPRDSVSAEAGQVPGELLSRRRRRRRRPV